MKLIRHISFRYMLFAGLIVMVSIPVFYFAVQIIMLHSLDENMLSQKQWIEKQLSDNKPDNFTSFNNEITIAPSTGKNLKDSIFDEDIFITADSEIVTHRVLLSNTIVNGQPYTIRIQRSLLENDELIKSIVILQLAILLLLLGGLFLINRSLSRKIWQPFYGTLQKLKNYRADKDHTLSLPHTSIHEFTDLNQSLIELTERTHKLYTAQKEFTENASHELQTPLAVLQSKLELLMQTTPLTGEQAGLITNLADAGLRMNRLNKTLLLLSKIENDQFPQTEKINIAKAVIDLLPQYDDAIQQKKIMLQANIQDSISIEVNKTIFDILIGNLVVNAITHTAKGGNVEISVAENIFRIKNTAKNGSLNTEKLFTRFQKQNGDTRGTGLGLQIVKKICSLYGHQVKYSFQNNQHQFSITFV